MALNRIEKLIVKIICIALVDALAIEHESANFNSSDELKSDPVLNNGEIEEFVGRKRRKGGGGGGHGGGDGGDGGKKKMMMMAMMCMKMKLMMMVPAMMGMMGMMSFKGMMFSMMSFMISKMMLLMKILEKKGGGAGGGGGGGDGSWAAGGGGGAWMPAGGQDYGGGGGYDSNAQWSSRSILEKEDKLRNVKPVITYIKPAERYHNDINTKKTFAIKNLNDAIIKSNNRIDEPKSRRKRGLVDTLQNAYLYWINKFLGLSRQKHTNYHKYRIVNGVKYYYFPIRQIQKPKTPKELPVNNIKVAESKPIVITEDFNKGEIVEGVVSRMNRKKFHKMKDNVNETLDDNPWE
ncbi:uncharacterized protein [Epargyreus clarus]|uniref:uncharacterized protein n=1 Tax=Epargyreus clarus TaxID=520877 RepID=UPI003C2B19A0